jgi:DNA-directed RNA polymerase subunit RPC12/RpoP
MRRFKCYDCQHEFEVPFGQGGRGAEMTCPKCGSSNVHRMWDSSTQAAGTWMGRGRAMFGGAFGRWWGGFGRGRGRGRGQGFGQGRGWWNNPQNPTNSGSGQNQGGQS